MKFKTKIFTGGGNTAGFWIPDDIVESFNKGRRVPVIVTINGYSYRNTITSYDGKFAVGVSIENRKNANVKVGDDVEIEIVYDDKPREIEVPEHMKKELNKSPEAKRIFNNLSYSKQKEFVQWISDAKKEETRLVRLHELNKRILEKSVK